MEHVRDWLETATDEGLARALDVPSLGLGRSYARAGLVSRLQVSRAAVAAQVGTVDGQRYHVLVHGGARTLHGVCTCPVRRSCSHVAAALLVARDHVLGSGCAWRRAFAGLLTEAADQPGGRGIGLHLSRGWQGLTLQAHARGRQRPWLQAGLSWLTTSEAKVDQTQAEAVELLGHTLSPGCRITDPRLLSGASVGVWQALRGAVDSGVELVAGAGVASVRLSDEPARVRVGYEPTADGGLVVATSIGVDGHDDADVTLVGDPVHGVVVGDDHLVLAPLERPLTTARLRRLMAERRVGVPAADVASFLATVHPVLARSVTLELPATLPLPTPEPPRLRLTVTWGEASAVTRWSYVYRVGGTEHEVEPGPARPAPCATGTSAAPTPVRDRAGEAAAMRRAAAHARPDADGRPTALAEEWVGAEALVRLHGRLAPLRAAGVEVVEVGEVRDLRPAQAPPTVRLSISDGQQLDWFDLDVRVVVDGHEVVFRDLFVALATGEPVMILQDGTWFRLDTPGLAALKQLIDEAVEVSGGDPDRVGLRFEHASLWDELVRSGVVADQSATWQQAVSALLDPASAPPAPLPDGLRATLRPYQRAGFEWLHLLWRTRLGGVLADDMGLGKTLQALALVTSLVERGEADRPVLVVAPTSVVGTWAAEAERFAPDLVVRRVEQTSRRRASLAEVTQGAHVAVTSYALLRLGDEEFAAQEWSLVLLDEAQLVKNHRSRTYQAVRRLRARTKLALTGTPLENNLMDLWSMLSITAPGLFPDPRGFAQRYRRPIDDGDEVALARLHRRVRPLLLRRTKETVARELPPKQETVVPVPLPADHRRRYDRELQAQRKLVLRLVGDLDRHRVAVLTALTRLRRLALSPALTDLGGTGSAKLDVLVDMVTEATAGGHRALVFSQFTSYLRMAEARLGECGVATVHLDGATGHRDDVVARFRRGEAPVFLISLKAGGFGLTLTEADYVFVLDPWWNPAAEAQAVDRAHRIGQRRPVHVYRLVSEGTIEEKVLELQRTKRDLFEKVVGGGADPVGRRLTADDVTALLEP